MIKFPNAKINLGLDIVERRPDGYHNIETVFYPIPLKDIVECVPGTHSTTILTTSGNPVDCPMEKNLVYKAYMLLQEKYSLPPVDIFLHKAIPAGAGLGGGSSDASFTLMALNEMFALGLSSDELCEIASKIGADCPFFIHNKPVMATGIGNIFSPVSVSLSGKHLLLVKPDVYVSTKEAYSMVSPRVPEIHIPEILKMPIGEWRKYLKNDFEESVFALRPMLAAIKSRLYDCGAVYASMSGSGSSIFGIFDNDKLAESCLKELNLPKSWLFSL